MSRTNDLVRRFRALFLSGNPACYARMNKPCSLSKYTKILNRYTREPLSITDAAIVAHLEGRATFATPLIGRDSFTREVALDIDQGGEVAICAGLRIAAELGYSAYGLVSQAAEGGHNGGHIRIPLADVASPERARLLAEQIQQAVIARCGLPENAVEVYPTQKGLRLPFGIHTHTGKRGALLLQDGTRLELDEGKALTTIAQALTLLEGLPLNNPDTLPMPPAAPISSAPVSPPNALRWPNSSSPIQDYNHNTNLVDWLISIGARVAYTTQQGGYLLHCPCNNHKHHDSRPSLEVQPARNPRHGRYILIGYAGGCAFETQPGRIINAFDAFCRWYGLDTRAAIRRLYR